MHIICMTTFLLLIYSLSECGDTGALVNKFIKASQAFAVDEDSLEIFALVVRCLEVGMHACANACKYISMYNVYYM